MNNPETQLHILLIEDSPGHTELILRWLRDEGRFKVRAVSTLTEAREAIGQAAPDLVLSDYRLPDGEGIEIMELAADCFPVIMMTSFGNEQVAVEVMKAGVVDYLVKSPESFAALPRIIDRAIREANLTRERNRAEEALRKSELLYRALFEQAGDGILFLSSEGKLLALNESLARMHGWSVDEIRSGGLELLNVNLAEPIHRERLGRIMSGEKLTFEGEHSHKDGRTFPVEVSASLIRIGEERMIIAFMRDISERRDTEQRRLEIEKQLQQAQRLESLGLLAGGIAHDFNNLLLVILGHTELIRLQSEDVASIRTDLDMIERAGKRAADLCSQMLSYAGKGGSRKSELADLRSVVSEMAKLLESSVSKKVTLQMRLEESTPWVMADAGQIRQVIMNLIINASEAIGSDAGRIVIETSGMELSDLSSQYSYLGQKIPGGRYARVSVADTGCGMDEETMRKIFDPFFTTKFTGRGLGMSAIMGIVNAHSGYIQLDSCPGAGTTFVLMLPAASGAGSVESTAHHDQVRVRAGATALLVDDELMVRDVGTALLETLGFRVLTADNGCDALDLYARHQDSIDLVLLDMAMPRMDGIEAFRALRSRFPGVKVVMASGYTRDDVAKELLAEGLLGFLQKPYSLDGLRHALAGISEGVTPVVGG